MSSYCSNCGTELPDTADVCTECGVATESYRGGESEAWLRLFSYLGSAVMYLFALTSFMPSAEYQAWPLSGALFLVGATLTLPMFKDYVRNTYGFDITPGLSLLLSILFALGGVMAVPT